jgi:D-tyrosyl-tRNA(Tyr) deacylase
VVQRVSSASVSVEGTVTGSIDTGLLVLLGVHREDTADDAAWLAAKVANLRVFPDAAGRMNASLLEIGGSALVVSQFTLYGDTRKGRRPSYDDAAPPETARTLYELFVTELRTCSVSVQCGVFQASMTVRLVNEGPVTLICDSAKMTNGSK